MPSQPSTNSRLGRFNQAVLCGSPQALSLLDQFEAREPQSIVLHTIDRTGGAPLRFAGSLLRSGSTRLLFTTPDKPNQDHWTINIYEVDPKPNTARRFVVEIVYRHDGKKSPMEHHWSDYSSVPARTLENDYDPLEYLRGFPPLEKFATQQEFLERQSELQFGQLVSELLREPL